MKRIRKKLVLTIRRIMNPTKSRKESIVMLITKENL